MQATLISRREKRKRGQGTSAPNKKRRASYTEAQMLQALESFEQDKENIYKGNATKFLKSYQATLPQGTTLPPSTFANHVKNRRNPSYAKSSLPSLGGPLALGKAGEDLLVSRLQQIQAEVSHLTNAIIVREALDIARTPQPGESKEVVASRVARCGGDDWLTGFKNRNNIKIKSKRRPVELERAVKNQPEETVQWLRLLLYGGGGGGGAYHAVLCNQTGMVLCECGQPAFTSIAQANSGRPGHRYYRCATDHCTFYRWHDHLYNHHPGYFVNQPQVPPPLYVGQRLPHVVNAFR